jgi:peptidoglycan/LPS O-acetylase OafA/YrhL
MGNHAALDVLGRADRGRDHRGLCVSSHLEVTESALARIRGWLSLLPIANQFPPLHGLRVLAIVSVLQVHVTVVFVQDGIMVDPAYVPFATVSATICFGMDLFFVMSGFLIGSMLLRTLERPGKNTFLRFYIRRAARIFPLYYAILTALTLLWASAAQKGHVWREYAFLTNYWPYKDPQVMGWAWSLCVEEHFYLTVPIILWLLHKLRSHRVRIALLVMMWLSALAIRLWFIHSRPLVVGWDDPSVFHDMYLPTHTRFDTLVAGIFLAYVQHQFGDRLRAFFGSRWARLPFYLGALGCLYVLMRPYIFGMERLFLWDALTWGTISSLMYVLLLLPLLNSDGIAQRVLGSSFMYRLATLSYGIYLVHVPVCERIVVPLAKRLAGTSMWILWPGAVLGLVACATIVAYGLHLIVEKPFLRLRERLAR